MRVLGIDGFKSRWVVVVLEDGHFAEVGVVDRLSLVPERFGPADAIGVDIPIGFPEQGARLADVEAKRFVGKMGNAVFPTPPRELLLLPHLEALARCRELGIPGISRQAHGLGPKILEAENVCEDGLPIFEVHPEVSFCAMNRQPLPFSKHTWNGLQLRRVLLVEHGIELPDTLPDAGRAAPDDVLDAAAAAWSAARVAVHKAEHFPEAGDYDPRRGRCVIWY